MSFSLFLGVSDSTILREACMKFRQLLMDVANYDAFESSITLPSACMNIFRQNFLQENTIAIIPSGGYRVKDKFSGIGAKMCSVGACSNLELIIELY
jgi:hypothetical protein